MQSEQTETTTTADEAFLTVRIPAGLKAELEAVARAEHRSISGQVRLFIEAGLATHKKTEK